MREVSGWVSSGAELSDGAEKEGEVIAQVSWYLVLLFVFILWYFNRCLWMSGGGITVAGFADVQCLCWVLPLPSL